MFGEILKRRKTYNFDQSVEICKTFFQHCAICKYYRTNQLYFLVMFRSPRKHFYNFKKGTGMTQKSQI